MLEAYDINSPFFYEAFVDHTTGKVKWGYFCEANDTTYSVLKLKQELKDLNNGSDIIKKQENVSEITKEEFFSKYYECCKFNIVRDWIRYLWIEHSILLTLSDLFTWVSKDHPTKLLSYTDFSDWSNKYVSDSSGRTSQSAD